MPSAPWPLIEICVAPVSRSGGSSLRNALLDLVGENPDVDFSTDPANSQFILKAGTEICLDAAIKRLRSFSVAFALGRPYVAYRERMAHRRATEHTHTRMLGGANQFAHVKLLFEPNEPGAGYALRAEVAEAVLPREYVSGVERGVASVLIAGVLAGCPVIDIKAELIDGAYHAIASSPYAFEIAARAAFREALHGNSVLIEPVMTVEIIVPERSAAGVIKDLQARRGLIRDRSVRGGVSAVTATVPLAEMLGFGSDLPSAAGDEARFAMAFSHYAPVPSPDFDPTPAVAALGA